jgi:hypothetical protein
MRGRRRITPLVVFAVAFALGCRLFFSDYRVGAYLFICGSFVLILARLLAEDRP